MEKDLIEYKKAASYEPEADADLIYAFLGVFYPLQKFPNVKALPLSEGVSYDFHKIIEKTDAIL